MYDVLPFLQGETHTSIHLSVRNDSTPETYEVFLVHLNNLQTFGIASAGHATFIQGTTTATISISASDRPHGVIELEAGSRMVTRNDEKNFTLTVSRLFGNIGKFVHTFYFAHLVTRYYKNWFNGLLCSGQSSNPVGQNKQSVDIVFKKLQQHSEVFGNCWESTEVAGPFSEMMRRRKS